MQTGAQVIRSILETQYLYEYDKPLAGLSHA